MTMQWIAITKPDFASSPEQLNDEVYILKNLLSMGFVRIHIRKLHASGEQIESMLSMLNTEERLRTVVHGHFSLYIKWNTWGLHIHHSQISDVLDVLDPNDHLISTSVHSIEELATLPIWINSAFIGPIFPSISKIGHFKEWDVLQLSEAIGNFAITQPATRLVALGGVEPRHQQILSQYNFKFAATLGYLWENTNSLHAAQQFFINHE